MATYVTLDEAKDHLRVTTNIEDADIQLKLDVAEAIILDYIKAATPSNQTIFRGAVLLQCAELYRFRGDSPGWEGQPMSDGQLSPAITNYLRRMRDPALV